MRVLLFFISIFLSCHLFSQSWPIGSIITVCEGETVTIRAQMPGATSHLWSTGATTCTITVTPTITTTYIVQIFINGQTIVDSSTVYVIQVDAGENDTICSGETAFLHATGGLFYRWYPETGLSDPTSNLVSVTTDASGTYYCEITSMGPNLIRNGDFELGNTDFVSQYLYNNTSLWNEGTYMVGTNPQTYHSGFSPCQDHTTGTGNFMIINGSIHPNTTIWQQVIQIVPNTDYIFSCWAQTVAAGNEAQLQFKINNTLIGPVFTCSDTVCHWTQFYTIWNSGTTTNATISIVNQNQEAGGNDFAIDDVFFSELKTCSDSVLVIVQNLQVDLGSDIVVCEGEGIQMEVLNPLEGANYIWVFGNTGATIQGPSTTHSYSISSATVENTGYYIVQGNISGCEMEVDTVEVVVHPNPEVDFTSQINCIHNASVFTNLSTGAVNYLWNFGDGCISNLMHPTYVFEKEGDYEVHLTASSQFGCEGSISQTVVVRPCEYHIYMPNTITPGLKDGLNDYLCLPPETASQIITFELFIVNRWGEVIYYTVDPAFMWDGKVNGKLECNTTYSYRMRVGFPYSKVKQFVGKIHVL